MRPRPSSLGELLERGAADDPALCSPDQSPLSYSGLRRQVSLTGETLGRLGIGPGQTVALVLDNGPAMASAFVSVAACAASAPLNPVYREEELDFYLGDLDASLLVVQPGAGEAARAAASKRGIPVAELIVPAGAAAGEFELEGGGGRGTAATSEQGGTNSALLLHTSGTTSRPKMVPLSQQNLCASASNVAESLALTPGDRCLNVMPLFHIHGLVAALLASLAAGASTFCSPGFDALRFFSWLSEAGATWYTAVPTMHQTILARAARNRETIAAAPLRFLRSSSASLPPQLMAALEECFDAPMIEAYGMTEAAHQMTSNPLPPLPRQMGSVGPAAGPEVEIMDQAGELLARSEVGEVVIRGPNVTAGYLNNPEANATAFVDGWFRTGDQGVIDEDGYLRLTGRLKEIINRGGEKISPREVDEVLLDHEAVAQVVTFARPHPKLGEDVAAAIVLREGAEVTQAEIRAFAGERLAPFKVPRSVLFVDTIPKGPTGKLQRIGLAEKLGLT